MSTEEQRKEWAALARSAAQLSHDALYDIHPVVRANWSRIANAIEALLREVEHCEQEMAQRSRRTLAKTKP